MNTNLKQTDKIKLLIFDLDETFWTGTLSSEKPILPIKYNIELVKTLVDRGIMCSISSKNDFEKAKETLQSMGVWDLFIFPSINWNSKGAQIKQLIQNAQLRDENVLFVDDNHLNLEEAKFHCPNIKTAFPNILTEILDFEGFKGKDDRKHSRLNQYKILEQKHIEKSTFNSNQEFLESSNIQVECKSINSNDIDRIIELILRTNQLNFTKKRIDKNTLSSILNNPNYESKCIFVKDRFGDYGLVGFYCLDKPNSELIHFIFSCRIMNLGVEQYIYAKLKFPKLNIIQPVSSTLDNKSCPSYINKKFKKVKQKTSKKALKVLLLGNCDIQALSHYAMSIYNQIKVLFYIDISKETHMQIRYDSIWKMKNAVNLLNEEKSYLIKMHKWLDKTSFDNRAIYDDYDVLVFSVLND
jgi:FkbH-like protein